MCYEFRSWSWKARAREERNERPIDSARREPAKTPAQEPERREVAREPEKTPA
jgi:hypothetical protein